MMKGRRCGQFLYGTEQREVNLRLFYIIVRGYLKIYFVFPSNTWSIVESWIVNVQHSLILVSVAVHLNTFLYSVCPCKDFMQLVETQLCSAISLKLFSSDRPITNNKFRAHGIRNFLLPFSSINYSS